MAMNGTQLGNEIMQAIATALQNLGYGDGTPSGDASHNVVWREIGKAIVAHIQNNAVTHQGVDSDGDTEPDGNIT